MGTNLTEMVREIRDLGAEPVLVTSLTRRSFNSDGTIADTLGPWADGKHTLTFFDVVSQVDQRFVLVSRDDLDF